jgi:SAM-dependent methyltransferase
MCVSRFDVAAALVIVVVASLAMAAADHQEPMFSEAEAYERFMGRWSRQLAPLFVRFAGVRDGETLLDVGSGTGALTPALASAAPSGRIVGIDPAPPYVALARARHGSASAQFEVGDAQQMSLTDGAFDRTVSLLVVNFIPDAAKAVDEMKRVTRRGGIVAAAVWDYGEGMEMLRVFWDEAVALRPDDDARDERHMRFCRRGELADLWRGRGLEAVEEQALTIETRFASFDDFWAPFLLKQGPAGAYVAALSPSDRVALEQRLRRRLLGAGPDRPIVLTARAWAVRGVAP